MKSFNNNLALMKGAFDQYVVQFIENDLNS